MVCRQATVITETMERAVASLREHRAYLAGLGGGEMSDPSFLREYAAQVAERFSGEFATSFELIPV